MIFKRSKRIILRLAVITFFLLIIHCIEKPVGVDYDNTGTNDTLHHDYTKIVIDTGGAYWGVYGNELYLLNVSKDNAMTIKKTKVFKNTSFVTIIQNNCGLTIVMLDSAIMYIKSVADSIVTMNNTVLNRNSDYSYYLRKNQYTVDNAGVFWFLPSSSYIMLHKWDGSEITTVSLSDYIHGNEACITALNKGVVIGWQDTSQRFVKLLHYSMNKITKTDSLSFSPGTFSIENVFTLDTTIKMLVRIHADLSNTGINTYGYYIASAEGKYLSIGKEMSSPSIISENTSDVVWISNYYSILKITSKSETELSYRNNNYFEYGIFFSSGNELFFYNRASGKISRLDNLAGYN